MFRQKKLTIIFYFLYCCTNICYGVEFYEVSSPYSTQLNKEYQHDFATQEDSVYQELDVSNIRSVYINNANKIYANQQDTNKKLIADKEENDKSKRQNFIENQEQKPQTTMEDKTKQKSWIEDWIPEDTVKPMDVVGAYTNFKIWLIAPMSTKISANEKRNIREEATTIDLFTGNVSFQFFPAFSIAIGNDKFKWFRWEVEFGYFPLLASNNGNIKSSDEMSAYTFNISKKELSSHLLTLSLNGAVQHAFFNKSLVFFFGMGIGVGYAFSASNTLSSDFVMPIISASFGTAFMMTKKIKMNIGYTFMYATMNIPSKYSFDRVNQYGVVQNNQAILGGSLKFNQILINGINVGFQFSTT